MNEAMHTIVAITTAIIGLAILSVLVSKSANTSGVIGAYTGGLATDIKAATGPISGGEYGMSSFG